MEFFIILAIALGAMWLMTSRTRKQQREAADFRANLEVGQEVMTGSGLYGTIVAVDGDVITLESTPGNETRWIRAAIARLVPPADDVDGVDEIDDDAEYEAYEDDDATYDDATYDADAELDGPEAGDATVPGDVRAQAPADRGAGSHAARFDVPDDLSTLDERRGDDGPTPR